MPGTSPIGKPQPVETGSTDYVRFIILTYARTGSTMLAASLNSSPNIICFRDLFNPVAQAIGFFVGGYDNTSAEDMALRKRDFKRFLRERIFCQHPKEIQAVGFKMPYLDFAGFPGLLEWLVEDEEIRVLHLRRRNLLRILVSTEIAWMTGLWFERRRPTLVSKLKPSNAVWAARHPLRAARRLWTILWPQEPPGKSLRAAVTLSAEECVSQFQLIESQAAHYDQLFQRHPKFTVYYEDILRHRKDMFNRMQSFLGVEPRPLTATTGRQNPEPLRRLIANYDELYAALKDTPEAAFFD